MADLDFELDIPSPVESPLYSSPESDAPSQESGERFVTFFFGDGLYGVPAAEVAEVAHPLPVTPLPNSPDILLGISVLRGDIVAVLNVRELFTNTADNAVGKAKFIILRSEAAKTQVSFRVDRMHEMLMIPETKFHEGSASPYILRTADANGSGKFHLLDAGKLNEALV